LKRIVLLCIAISLLAASAAYATLNVNFYVDVAPNKVLDPASYTDWYNSVKPQVAAGTFVNMSHGPCPGECQACPWCEWVYTSPPYGCRITWIYWVPNVSEEEFLTHNLAGKMTFDWDGVDYTYNFPATTVVPNSPSVGWATVKNYEVYNGGVIGAFGHAWVGTNCDIDKCLGHQTYARGWIRYTGSPEETRMVEVRITPEPASIAFIATGLVALVGYSRRRARR